MSGAVVQPDTHAILRARAVALARPPEVSAADEAMLEVLEFRLAQEHYALETRHVREVYPLKSLTPLPTVPAFVLGIVNVRGRILPVLDLKRFFGLPDVGLTDLHRIIVVSGQEMELGLVADVSVGVRTILRSSLTPPPPMLNGIGADYVSGVTAERLIVLDLERIVMDPRIIVNEQVET